MPVRNDGKLTFEIEASPQRENHIDTQNKFHSQKQSPHHLPSLSQTQTYLQNAKQQITKVNAE